MSRRVPLLLAVLALLPLLSDRTVRAADDDLRAVAKDLKQAFRALDLPPTARLDEDLRGRLPEGIVTEAGPFDTLVGRLLEPHAERLAARKDALARLVPHASPEAARHVAAAFKVLEKETEKLAKRLTMVEVAYAEVFNLGYMSASETERRTRKAAAVLVPFYRTLLLADAALVDDAADVLAGMSDGENLAWLAGPGLAESQAPFRAAAVEALGRIGGEAAREALVRVLAEDRVSTIRSRALAALFRWPVRAMREALLAALGDPAWEVRALAVAACRRARLLDAVGPLILALAREEGRLRTDIDDALHALVGTRLYADLQLWTKWWTENREEITAKAREREAAGAYDEPLGPVTSWTEPAGVEEERPEERRGGTTTFYGIETRSKRVVFVVDISFSMDQPADGTSPGGMGGGAPHGGGSSKTKLAMAKEQLRAAIESLPDDATCNLVVYSESYAVWDEEMALLKSRSRKRLDAFIADVRSNGTTNICDALDRALELAGASPLGLPGKASELAADTIFLLSDGDPNRGRISRLDALLDDFWRRTARARIVVHTIGIGEAAGSTFLRELARRTGGRYVGAR